MGENLLNVQRQTCIRFFFAHTVINHNFTKAHRNKARTKCARKQSNKIESSDETKQTIENYRELKNHRKSKLNSLKMEELLNETVSQAELEVSLRWQLH